MGKRDTRYSFMNPIAIARARGPPASSGPTIRDYLGRQRPTWEEVKVILQKKKEGCSTLAAWEERMNEKYKQDLQKQRDRVFGEGSRPKSKERKRRRTRVRYT